MPFDMEEPIVGDASFGSLAPMLTTPLPLFASMQPQSVTQQLLTNCPLPALLAAMAHAAPSWLRAMVSLKTLPTPRTSWFKGKDLPKSGGPFEVRDIVSVRFQNRTVEISPLLYYDLHRKPRFAFADDGQSGWTSYIEKAYVVYRGRHEYRNLDLLDGRVDALSVERIIEDIATDFDKFDIVNRQLLRDMEPISFDPPPGVTETFQTSTFKDFGNRRSVTEGLKDFLKLAPSRPTVATDHNHTRAVFGYEGGNVILFDALSNRRPRTLHMPLDTFMSSHEAVYQVRV